MDVLRELPALVVLERFPVPVLATGEDGAILFANSAFADMLGYTAEQVLVLKFHQIFHAMPADESAVNVLRQHADLVVELVHQDGSIKRARKQVGLGAGRRSGGAGGLPGPDRAAVVGGTLGGTMAHRFPGEELTEVRERALGGESGKQQRPRSRDAIHQIGTP
jgi:PAS domain-containing protein